MKNFFYGVFAIKNLGINGLDVHVASVGQVTSVILRRRGGGGVELRYKNYSQLQFNSLFELTMHP